MSSKDDPIKRLDFVHNKYTDLLAEMERVKREHLKNKKRSEQLQKERDQTKSELNKTNGLKTKLEQLCRELQKEAKKAKVYHLNFTIQHPQVLISRRKILRN
jgi:chromosome segregation ATPase